MQVLNKETGEKQTIEDSSLPDLVLSGKVQIPKKDYEFTSPEGEKYSIPAQGFADAVKMGWKYRDQNILKQEELEKKYGDQTTKALLYGGARGLTLGLSDVALEKTGLVSEEELREVQQRNPEASLIGDVAGTAGPALLSGGTGLVGRVASKLPSAILAETAERVGKRAAQNIVSTVGKQAATFATAGAVEGAAVGFGQTISEAELGNAEFNAESLLANVGTGALLGAGIGGALGGSMEYVQKATRGANRKILSRAAGQIEDPKLKAGIEAKIADDVAMEEGLLALKDPEMQRLKAEYPDAPISKGMESAYRPVKMAENYLFDAPSIAGEEIRNTAKELTEYVERNVDEIWSGAKTASAEQTGDLIRQTFITKINEPWQSGKAFYDEFMGELGGLPVNDKFRKQLATKIRKSDAFRIGAEGADIKRVLGLAEDGMPLTLRQLKELQSDIGASVRVAKGSEQKLLIESYDKLREMMDSVVKDSITGKKGADKIIKSLDAANADYVRAYQAKDEIADLFGIKGKNFDEVLEKLEGMSAIDLDKKFVNLKKSDKAYEVLSKYPEIGKLVISSRQNALLSKHILKDDVVNYAGIKKDLAKLSKEERLLYFGGDKAQEKKLIDMLTLYEKRPKTLNPSGTDIRNELRNFLSPKEIFKNWAFSTIYRGSDSELAKYVTKVVPTLGAVEQSANKTKNKISASVGRFFKAVRPGVAAGSLEGLSDKKLDKAMKSYEDVQQNPEKMIDDFTKNNKDLSMSAPNTYSALQASLIAGVQFLQSKTPKPDQEYMIQNRTPSRSELMKFNDYVEAVETPAIVFDQLSQGYVNPNTIEALKVVYPQILQGIVAEVNAKKPKNISRTQAGELHKLLGVKTTPAWDFDKMMILQNRTPESKQAQIQANAEISGKVPLGGAKEIDAAGRNMTGFQRSMNRA